MDYSTLDVPALHHLSEFAQTHVHWVGDAIQPFHPLTSPSPPAFNLSQHQGLFQWVGSSNQVGQSIGTSASASVLPFSLRFLIFHQIELWRPSSIQFPFYSLFWVLYQISWVSLSEQRFTDSHSVWFDAMAVNTQTVLCACSVALNSLRPHGL